MGALTEIEIFDVLIENFRLSAEYAEKLASEPKQGANYNAFRGSLKLVEGACRQAAHWRGDARWLPLGMKCEEAHQRAGNWIRTDKGRVSARWKFLKLAEILRGGQKTAMDLKNKRTHRTGLILPDTSKGPMRQGRPVQVKRPSGLIVPAEYAV